MQIQLGGAQHSFSAGPNPSLIATVLLGLIATVSIPPGLAHEVIDRRGAGAGAGAHVTASNGDRPAVRTGLRGMTAERPIQDEGSLAAAVDVLLCLEARRATRAGELDQEVLDWIGARAHTCLDERLLFDAFGF